MNVFELQIVKMVREDMSDEGLLALVRSELGAAFPPPRGIAPPPPRKATPKSEPAEPTAPKRIRKRGKAKRRMFDPKSTDKVFHAIRMAKRGVSIGDVEGYTKIPRGHVQRALGELVKSRKVFRAGERRFTRYATNKAAAQKAAKAR